MDELKTTNTELAVQITALQNDLTVLREKVNTATAHAALSDTTMKQIVALENTLNLVRSAVNQNDQEIDALQIEAAKAHRPWYRDATVMVALLALLFSFGTTVVSYYRTTQQDVHDSRAELRTLLQRLNVLPRENLELGSKYDATTAVQLSSMINAENSLIVDQAAQIVARISNHVTTTECLMVARALTQAGRHFESDRLHKQAFDASQTPFDEMAACRSYAQLKFTLGDVQAGREYYQKALEVFQKSPSQVPYLAEWSDAWTESYWATDELNRQNLTEATQYLKKSSALMAKLPQGLASEQVNAQLKDFEKKLRKLEAGLK